MLFYQSGEDFDDAGDDKIVIFATEDNLRLLGLLHRWHLLYMPFTILSGNMLGLLRLTINQRSF